LSDLHFGRVDEAILEGLAAYLTRIRPDVIVVSGDLTQRARAAEFKLARRFLDRLPHPQIVVPGNHDVPLYRFWERFLAPLRKYRRYITEDLEPSFIDSEIGVFGINTARSLTFKDGRVDEEQIARIRRRLESLDKSLTTVVVTHHPFAQPSGSVTERLVGGADMALATFSRCGVDVILSGQFHTSQYSDTPARSGLPGYSAMVVQAATATSTRVRGESNSFNLLHVSNSQITVQKHAWQLAKSTFEVENTERFERSGDTWEEAAA
jgi:3',5'-cyclic AMP phosphodiesterase CpdA